MYIRTTNLLALYIRSTRRYDHPLFGGPGLSGRGCADLYSSTSSMLWKGSCGQFALDWFGLHSILVPPPGTMISCPTYSIFPGKRKSSSMHRNVLSTSFRSGSLAIFPLAVGGLFLALSMHELRRS
jgi:hypothetical protein